MRRDRVAVKNRIPSSVFIVDHWDLLLPSACEFNPMTSQNVTNGEI